jgi:unsaturated chondroitin disaccharide hydrolase
VRGRRLTSAVLAAGVLAVALACAPGSHPQRLNRTAASAASPERLLLHRVAVLQREVPRRGSYVGDVYGVLHVRRAYWTSGFLAGSLWQAATLTHRRTPFSRWALARTTANFGRERADTHDLGFIYGLSSVTAYRRLCRTGATSHRCRVLRRSAVQAARTLLSLAATNRVAGTLPTHRHRPSSAEADTIIDSLMNLPLLYWATRETSDPRFRRVAARHVARVVRTLLRPDGSTFQSVHFDRKTGRLLRLHTHQGLSSSSTWSRGQGWAVYGLTTSAEALRDPAILVAAERSATWVAAHLPRSGVPRWDYSARPGAATDVSAGAITAAGLYRLASLCQRWGCAQPYRWRPLANRMLDAVLKHVSRRAPLGYLGGSAGTYGRGPHWDDNAELVYALYYTLEALNLRRKRGSPALWHSTRPLPLLAARTVGAGSLVH